MLFKTPLIMAAAMVLLFAPAHPAQATDGAATAGATVGQAAPAFTGLDSNGKTHSLADFKGKTVVLEWTNHECPYVRKVYDTNVMQSLQKDATDKGVVWLTINSGAPGKQGHTDAAAANAQIEKEKSHETARILDPEGTIGKLYGASTTPHMFVINGEGVLVYAGAIDDQPSANQANVKEANNYVKAALDSLAAGEPIAVASTKPYGCAVKY